MIDFIWLELERILCRSSFVFYHWKQWFSSVFGTLRLLDYLSSHGDRRTPTLGFRFISLRLNEIGWNPSVHGQDFILDFLSVHFINRFLTGVPILVGQLDIKKLIKVCFRHIFLLTPVLFYWFASQSRPKLLFFAGACFFIRRVTVIRVLAVVLVQCILVTNAEIVVFGVLIVQVRKHRESFAVSSVPSMEFSFIHGPPAVFPNQNKAVRILIFCWEPTLS